MEEYLLKPINGEELLQVVRRVAHKIREEQESTENLKKYQKDSLENRENAKRNLFTDLISSEPALTEVIDRSRELGLELTAECYNILLLKVQRKEQGAVYSKRILEIFDTMDAFLKKYENSILCFDRAPEGKTFLFLGENEDEINKNIQIFTDFFTQTVSHYTGISYFGSIGRAVFRLRELALSYESASHAFAYRFLVDRNQIIRIEDIKKPPKNLEKEGDCLIGSVDTGNLDKNKIDSFLRGGDIDEIRYFVEEYIKNTGEAGSGSLIFRQYIVMDMYFAAIQFLKHIDKNGTLTIEEPFQSPEQMQDIISKVSNTVDYVAELFRKVMTLRDRQTIEHNSDVVETARQYILKNYGNEDLTLNIVASHVNVSPSHLSALFSQKTGQTFVKYLTNVRMDKARELLKCFYHF